MIDRNIIGQRITALRKAHNLTQSELADLLGVTHQAVSQWERSETLPDILILPKLAEIFGETTDHFLGLTEETAEKEVTDVAQTETDAEETLPSEDPQEPENPGEPIDPIDPADLPERTVRIGSIDEDASYTVVLRDANGNETEVPVPLAERLQIVLEGSCADLTSMLSVHVEGDVNGDVTTRASMSVGGDVNGDVTTGAPVAVGGDVNGDVTTRGAVDVGGDVGGDIDCGALTVNGDVSGDVDSTTLTVNGDVGGDVDSTTLTINGSCDGDVEADTITVNGEVSGDISCDDGTVTVNGDVGGDVSAKFIAATGDIGGDVNTDYAILSGDIGGDFSGKRTFVTDAQSIPWEAILSAVIERDVDKLRQYFAK